MGKLPWQRGPFGLERIAQDAEECARTLGLDPAEAVKRVQLVVSAFGWDWIRNEWERTQKQGPHALLIRRHPLVRHLDLLERLNVYALVETGRYIIEFADDPKIDEVLQDMKGRGQFQNHLFALAMAYRFTRVGARVRLEPPTERGRADFLMTVHGTEVCTECYRQGHSDLKKKIDTLAKQISTWHWHKGRRRCVVRITLCSVPKQALEPRVQRLVRRARESFDESGITSIQTEEFCRVSVQPLPTSLEGPPDFAQIKGFLGEPYAYSVVSEPCEAPFAPHVKGEEYEIAGARCRHVWALYLEGDAAIDQSPLTMNLRRKLAQAKRSETGRLLCVESHSYGKPFELSAESPPVREEMHRIFDEKLDVVGVIFAERCWNEKNGAGFHLQQCVNLASHFRLPAEVWQALFQYERNKGPMG